VIFFCRPDPFPNFLFNFLAAEAIKKMAEGKIETNNAGCAREDLFTF